MHGISVQDFASGNVFRSGIMEHGTFDSHRGLPFDTVRTDIVIHNDGNPGGAGDAGPHCGRGMVHWNIRIVGGRSAKKPEQWGRWVNDPALHPHGVLAGVVGAPIYVSERASRPDESLIGTPLMPDGISSGVVFSAAQIAAIPDVFLEQQKWLDDAR